MFVPFRLPEAPMDPSLASPNRTSHPDTFGSLQRISVPLILKSSVQSCSSQASLPAWKNSSHSRRPAPLGHSRPLLLAPHLSRLTFSNDVFCLPIDYRISS